MIDIKTLELWFVTGSQHLYGPETLRKVRSHAEEISKYLDKHDAIVVNVKYKGVVTTPDEIHQLAQEANYESKCIGLILWMHTFSPAKMWIRALKILQKPILHFHTQYNAEVPWSTIDMDFMNENQSAHGGREFGFIASSMGLRRKVVVGHWQEEKCIAQIGIWGRVAAGWQALQSTKIARIGDNMREVAVTEGNKIEAQLKFGFSVNGYSINEVEAHVDQVPINKINKLVKEYKETYSIVQEIDIDGSLFEAARIELGLRSFLTEGGFTAFTDTFENLGALKQLPGIAVQRLMADGYGFGAEGDWKTAALLRAAKVMELGLPGGTSFMEDYTYDFMPSGGRVIGSHMLEICPSIALGTVRCEVHPLGIGGKEDPVRLVFNVESGPAINASLVDLGGRYRLVVNEVTAITPEHDLPKLPVARVLWNPKPNLEIAAKTWILSGGAHHTVFSKSITTEYMEDLADLAGIEIVVINDQTTTSEFKEKLRWNEVYYHLFPCN